MKTVVVALGGNAILKRNQLGTVEEQIDNVCVASEHIASLIEEGYRVVITHGNGPQVGNLLIQNEAARDRVPAMPMDLCVAQSQGMIGFMFQTCLTAALKKRHLSIPVATVITRTLVHKNDPAFKQPTKPIGPFFSKELAEERMGDWGGTWIEDSGRGWRRVVPSPKPYLIVESPSIKALLALGHVVICTGGGGVPVVQEENGDLVGIEAVVDKDLAAERLAVAVEAQILMILTDVKGIAIGYGTSEEHWLNRVSPGELGMYMEQGYFAEGSMKPKVKAAIRFVESSGGFAVITCIDKALEAVRGEEGTWVMPLHPDSPREEGIHIQQSPLY